MPRGSLAVYGGSAPSHVGHSGALHSDLLVDRAEVVGGPRQLSHPPFAACRRAMLDDPTRPRGAHTMHRTPPASPRAEASGRICSGPTYRATKLGSDAEK